MKDPISWDPSLVKKYSSSNHYKLLNQLRNEVKKYPLNNKKNSLANQTKDTNPDNKIKSNSSHSQNRALSNNSSIISETNSNNSTISFNNAKNFSIYNQKAKNKSNAHEAQNINNDHSKSIEERSAPTFKDRLKQIDMK